MKIGFSLSPALLRNEPRNEAERNILQHYGDSRALLLDLKNQGVDSIELRNIYREERQDCAPIYELIWDQGLQLTVHGRLEGVSEGETFADDYPSLKYALDRYHLYQEQLVIPVHAYADTSGSQTIEQLSDATVKQLKRWLEQVRKQDLHVHFAVEINRWLPEKVDPGGSVKTLLALMDRLDEPEFGICWDMGHHYANGVREHQYTERADQAIIELPEKKFLMRTTHTHIHGLSSKGCTHFPLMPEASLPLEPYVDALKKAGYSGIYNLELDAQRFFGESDLFEGFEQSISRLKSCLHH